MNAIGRLPILFAALIIGAACCFLPSCRKKEPEPERIVTAAAIDEILAEAESYGQTQKALDTLRSAWETIPSRRLAGAAQTLYRSQWKETRRVVTTVTDGEENTFTAYEAAYDERGNLSFEAYYETDGSLAEKNEYAYDGDGNEKTRIQYAPDGSVVRRTENAYDTDGHLIAETTYVAEEGFTARTEYRYDAAGQLISRESCTDGMPGGRTELTYDENGNLILQIMTDGDGSVTSRHENKFDADGNPLSETSFRADGSVSSKKEYTYDEAGRLILEKQSRVRTARTRAYEYDGEGRMTRSVCTDEDKRQVYIYDGAGNTVSVTVYRPDGAVNLRSEYTFDAAGNTLSYVLFGGDGHIISGSDAIYDERGHEICRTEFGKEGALTSRTEYSYDTAGNLTETAVYGFEQKYEKNGYLRRRTEYVWEDGALSSEIRYAAAGNVAERIDREYAFIPLE